MYLIECIIAECFCIMTLWTILTDSLSFIVHLWSLIKDISCMCVSYTIQYYCNTKKQWPLWEWDMGHELMTCWRMWQTDSAECKSGHSIHFPPVRLCLSIENEYKYILLQYSLHDILSHATIPTLSAPSLLHHHHLLLLLLLLLLSLLLPLLLPLLPLLSLLLMNRLLSFTLVCRLY